MIRSAIVDALSGRAARVGGLGSVRTREIGFPVIGIGLQAEPFVNFFRNSAGSESMLVNGSVTQQVFSVDAPHDDCDRYVKTISWVIADGGASLNEFASFGNELANGILFRWRTNDRVVQIFPTIQSNFDVIQLCGGQPAFGDGATVFRANNMSGPSEGYIPILDFAQQYGFPWGLRLRGGTDERLEIVIRDNLTGADRIDVQARGFDLFPDEE